MSKAEKEVEEATWEPSEEWKRIQLTPEQKAEARAELQKRIDAAAAAGVYERLMELQGKVQWNLDLEELRRDRD
jgi:CRISPR/Cas system-associated exonuclease Cas4 (RecB family)